MKTLLKLHAVLAELSCKDVNSNDYAIVYNSELINDSILSSESFRVFLKDGQQFIVYKILIGTGTGSDSDKLAYSYRFDAIWGDFSEEEYHNKMQSYLPQKQKVATDFKAGEVITYKGIEDLVFIAYDPYDFRTCIIKRISDGALFNSPTADIYSLKNKISN